MILALLGLGGRTGCTQLLVRSGAGVCSLLTAPLATLYGEHRPADVRSQHSYNRHLLPQPMDTLQLTPILQRIRLLEDAAVPVLKYGEYMSPAQTSMLLARLPYILSTQLHRLSGLTPALLDDEQLQLRAMLLESLSSRFSHLAKDCSNQQLVQGILGLAHARYWHPSAHQAAAEQLQQRLAGLPLTDLAAATWGMAAAWIAGGSSGQFPYQSLLSGVAQHVMQVAGGSPALPASTPLPAAGAQLLSEQQQQQQQQHTPLDHLSLAKLAAAFDSLGYADEQLWAALSGEATRLINSQLQAHKEGGSQAPPRTRYLHTTLTGEIELESPHQLRQSQYMYRPHLRAESRDFQLTSLGPTLRAITSRAGQAAIPLLQAAAKQLAASSRSSSLLMSLPPGGSKGSSARRQRIRAGQSALSVLSSLAHAGAGTSSAADLMLAIIAEALPRGHNPTTSQLAALALDLGTRAGARPHSRVARTLLTHLQGILLPLPQPPSSQPEERQRTTTSSTSDTTTPHTRPTHPGSPPDLPPAQVQLDGTESESGAAYVRARLAQVATAAGGAGAAQHLAAQVDRLGAHTGWDSRDDAPAAGAHSGAGQLSGGFTHVKTYNSYRDRSQPSLAAQPGGEPEVAGESLSLSLSPGQAARLALVLVLAGREVDGAVEMLDRVADAVADQPSDTWDLSSAGVLAAALSHVKVRQEGLPPSLRYAALLQQLKDYAHSHLHTGTAAQGLTWMGAGARLGDRGLVARAMGQVSRQQSNSQPLSALLPTVLSSKAAVKLEALLVENVMDTSIIGGAVYKALAKQVGKQSRTEQGGPQREAAKQKRARMLH